MGFHPMRDRSDRHSGPDPYSFFLWLQFGDAGQGLCLMLGGYLLYRAKKMNLAAIISCCGFFSTIFGFLFGSVFGFENIIKPLWRVRRLP